MPVVSAHNLCHAYGDQTILDDVSLTVQRGECVGLLGNNGTGKSTLAAILVGTIEPDSGEVSRRKNSGVSYLAQETDFSGFDRARDYILAGLSAWAEASDRHKEITEQVRASEQPPKALLEAQAAASDEIERLGGWDQMHRVDEVADNLRMADLDQPLDQMSGGERRRVALARVLVARPPFAVLDEPTNHLDIETIEWLEGYLSSDYPGAILLITHDRYFLDRLAQRTLELDAGKLYSYDGGWESYLLGKAERLAQRTRAESNRQNTLRRELDWLKRSPKARTTKQQARVDRVEALRDTTSPVTNEPVAKLAFTATRTGKTIFQLSDLHIELGGKQLISGLDLTLKPGERIGIIGNNGAGKTSLLRVLLGQLEPSAGTVTIGLNTRFAYFDQERTKLDDNASILENIAANRDVVTVGGRDINAKSYLARFMFTGERQRHTIANLSGGERARVAIAKFLLEKANVLLLDEPTNDLDVATLAALEELLIETSATVLFVTHDRYFLDRVATAVLAFEDDGRVVRYAGSYQALRHAREQERRQDVAETEPAVPTTTKIKTKTTGLTFTEQHELDALMPQIEQAEIELAELDAQLADPNLYATRGDQVSALREKQEQAQKAVSELISRWEELEGKM